MEIYKIVGVAIVSTVLISVVKPYRKEIAVILSVMVGIVLFSYITLYIKSAVSTVYEVASRIDLDLTFIKIILKIIAVSYVCEFGSQICKDAGEMSIASKVELAGKVIIVYISMPIVMSLFEIRSGIN